jgi:hypothetical protein
MFRDEELPPEEVDKVLESIARKVVDREMEMYAKFILGMSWPLAFIGGQLGRVFISPYLFIFGDKENTVSKNIFLFEKKENIFKLIDKIDELTEEREELKKDDYKGKENEKEKSALWKRFKEFMRF